MTYDLRCMDHIYNLEGHCKRILSENFELTIKEPSDVLTLSKMIGLEYNKIVAAWIENWMRE